MKLYPACLVFVALLVAALPARADSARSLVSLNADWHFHFGDIPGAETPSFDDSGWAQIRVPHTWNALDGQDGSKNPSIVAGGDYARGTGWYRRSFTLPAASAGKQAYLEFDGANRRADVYLNGKLVGTHLGGNSRFRFDISTALNRGGENLLAVKVNNENNAIIPQSADFTFFGGLYRNVSLLITDPVQIETMDHGSPGVFLQQKSVSSDRAEVAARVEVANHTSAPQSVSVRVKILTAAGIVVTEGESSGRITANGSSDFTAPIAMDHPHLWNGRTDPYLYTALVEVAVDGRIRDSVSQPLGLRYFRIDPQQGFFLNGKYLDLHGVSRHQDRINKGWAISPEDEREDFSLIAEMGCTAIRVAHYQQSPLWYTLADQQGLVLWSEIPFVDEAIPSPIFFDNALEQMRELIRQNYNHPSVFFWGCGNENFDAGKPFAEGVARYGPLSEHLIKELNKVAGEEDKTRLTTYASFHSETEVAFGIPGQPVVRYQGEPQRWYTDVTAFNKYYGWYYGEPDDSAVFFDGIHRRNPEQRIGVSEFGAGGCITQHEPDSYGQPGYQRTPMEKPRKIAFGKIHPEEYQAYYHEQTWKEFKARPYLWAKFAWNMFDFASDGRNEGDQPGRNDKGLVTFDRKTRKDAFYFYKANWSTEPVLYITSRRFVERTNPVTEVKVYSNAAEAELFVNGHSVGKQMTGDDKILRWPAVHLDPGANQIRVVSSSAPLPLSDACTWQLAVQLAPQKP